jgi:zinc transporter ZupT
MRSAGRRRAFVIGLWSATAALLTGIAVVGRAAGGVAPKWLGFLLSFAGGAVLASSPTRSCRRPSSAAGR